MNWLKRNWPGIIAIIALALSATTFRLFWIRIEPFKFTSDGVIGAMATLMGICATIIVCFQIISYFVYNNELRKLKEAQDEFKKEKESLFSELKLARYFQNIDIGDFCLDHRPIKSLNVYLFALQCRLESKIDVHHSGGCLDRVEKCIGYFDPKASEFIKDKNYYYERIIEKEEIIDKLMECLVETQIMNGSDKRDFKKRLSKIFIDFKEYMDTIESKPPTGTVLSKNPQANFKKILQERVCRWFGLHT